MAVYQVYVDVMYYEQLNEGKEEEEVIKVENVIVRAETAERAREKVGQMVSDGRFPPADDYYVWEILESDRLEESDYLPSFRAIEENREGGAVVFVSDYIARKSYFDDSEIVGWFLKEEKKGTFAVYHLYRRFISEYGEEINDLGYDENDELFGVELKNELGKINNEIDMQNEEEAKLSDLEKAKKIIGEIFV